MTDKDEAVQELTGIFARLVEENYYPPLEAKDMTIEKFSKLIGLSQPATKSMLEKEVQKGNLRKVVKRNPENGNKIIVYEEANE